LRAIQHNPPRNQTNHGIISPHGFAKDETIPQQRGLWHRKIFSLHQTSFVDNKGSA
jgi:hypothetical protein